MLQPAGPGPEQRRTRRPPAPVRGDRQDPRRPHPGQAGPARPRPGGRRRLRDRPGDARRGLIDRTPGTGRQQPRACPKRPAAWARYSGGPLGRLDDLLATLPLNAETPPARCLSVCGLDAEVVAVGILHPGVALESLAHGGTECRQPIDLGEPLGRCEVEMERRLRSPLEVDLLEIDPDVGAVDDDTRIRLGCASRSAASRATSSSSYGRTSKSSNAAARIELTPTAWRSRSRCASDAPWTDAGAATWTAASDFTAEPHGNRTTPARRGAGSGGHRNTSVSASDGVLKRTPSIWSTVARVRRARRSSTWARNLVRILSPLRPLRDLRAADARLTLCAARLPDMPRVGFRLGAAPVSSCR